MTEPKPRADRTGANLRTGGQLLVECLRENGVKRAYGVPGESYLDLLDALLDSDVDYITCRQEGGAAMAAAAHGQLTGEPGVCMVTRGPGATNASAGLHIARQGGLPLLLLIGQVPRDERGRGVFQEIDYRRMLSEVTKWTEEIDDANRIPEFVARAFTVARSGFPGPVALALPEDMLADAVDVEPVRAAEPAPRGPSAKEVEAVLQAFRGSVASRHHRGWKSVGMRWLRPHSAASPKAFQAPVAFSFRAQDVLDNEHPCAVGPIGIGGNRGLAPALLEADLILALGARIGSGTSVVEDALLARPAGRTLIHVHPDPEELGRVVVPDLAIAAEAPEIRPSGREVRLRRVRSAFEVAEEVPDRVRGVFHPAAGFDRLYRAGGPGAPRSAAAGCDRHELLGKFSGLAPPDIFTIGGRAQASPPLPGRWDTGCRLHWPRRWRGRTGGWSPGWATVRS